MSSWTNEVSIMKVALLPNLTRNNARQVTDDVCAFLKKNGIEYFFEKELQSVFGENETYLDDGELFSKSDIVIAIGGDGTIIHAAKKAYKYSKAILGINAGNLAFMAGLEQHETEMLSCLINNEYTIDRRMLLEMSAVDKDGNEIVKEDFCLNDIVIARGDMIKLIRLNVSCDGENINEYYADGIIVSTPTGTTAYSLSAGGPVVDPRIESIVVTPICTHSLFARSIIFDSESEICVSVPLDEKEQICISCDGDNSIIIPAGSKVTIRKSSDFADFIRIKNDSFIDVLNSKLAQRRM